MYLEIGSLIKEARRLKRLSQVHLAAQTGVSLPTIQNIEANKGNPTVTVLEKLFPPLGIALECFSVEPDWVLLQKCGLPIDVETKKRDADHYPTFQDLTRELTRAVRCCMKELQAEEKRIKESVAAMLWVIRYHYPTFYLYNLENSEISMFLKQNPITGRIVKLMRMLDAKLSLIL